MTVPEGADARRVAIDVLVAVEDGAFSNLVLPELLRASGLGTRDRAFVTHLVAGTLRWQRRLDAMLAPHLRREPGALDAPVRAALRVGAFQLHDGVPVHAAVSATVDATRTRAPRATGLVNAVLRRAAAGSWSPPTGDDERAVGIRTSRPDWVVGLLRREFGEDVASRVLAIDNESPTVTLRVRGGPEESAALRAELEAAGAEVGGGRLVPGALRVRGIGDPARLPAIAQGRATPQDEASQAVAALAARDRPARALDVAAAPGGKSCALAEAGAGVVVAGDPAPRRLALVGAAATRLGLSGVLPVVHDGRALPHPPGAFDAVLLDAPCSGLGVLRRRPEARWRIHSDDVGVLAGLQRELAVAALDACRPGGRFVYAVCTYTPEETTAVDEWLAVHRPDLVADAPPPAPWRAHGRGALLLPGDADTDGMFVLVGQREPARGTGTLVP